MARIEDKRSFKAINFDEADEYLEDGDTRGMLNVRVGYSEDGSDGNVTNVKGTKSLFSELSFSLPSGTNKCVGSCNDDQNNRLVWLNYNSNSDHGVYCYNNDSNTIETIMESSVLNFSGELINSIDILNNNLAWVDENRPRGFNVASALAGDIGTVTIEEQINDAKVVPILPPVCTTTITRGEDYIKSLKSFQFIYRYVFINGEKGAWSSVSKLVPTGYAGNHISKITLDVSACELFTKTPLQNIIAFVEFASRELYTFNFNQFLRISASDLVSATGIVDYYDTESKSPVDTAETNISFYENPIKAGSVAFQNDRKFYADCTEGYDAFNVSLSNVNVQVIPASGGIPYLSDCNTHTNDRYLKPDSEYSYSIEFKDTYARKSGAIDLPELTIRTQAQLSNDYKANVLQFGVNLASAGSYPAWADTFEIIRSDNKSVTFFVQGRANRVLYCTGYDTNDDPVYINSGANATSQNVSDSNAIEIHIDIANWTKYDTNIGYSFTEGDKVTFLTMGGVLDSPSFSSLKGLKIKELRGSLLIVDYPEIGRTNLNHTNLVLTDRVFDSGPYTITNAILSRFMVGDNGVVLYSLVERMIYAGFDPPFPLTYPFPYTGVSQVGNGFPTISNNLYGISLIYGDPENASNIDMYIVGSGGYFIKGSFNPLANSFGTWTPLSTGVSSDINAIESSFTNHNKTDLILVGDNGVILKYTRASDTFVAQTSGTTENLNYIYRESTSNSLIAVGDNGTILRTTDNGNTWTQVVIDNCQNLNGVYFTGSYVIVVGDEGLVLYSNDSGVTFTQVGVGTAYNLNSVEGDGALSTTRAYIAGDNGFFAQFDLTTGLFTAAYNTGTTKNINFFQSYWTTGIYYDLGIGVGELDLLQDVSVPLLSFTNYSSDVSTIPGSFYLNYRAKIEVFSPKTVSGPTIFYETGDAYKVGQNYTFNKGKESDGDVFLIKKDFRGTDWSAPGELIFSMTPNSKDTAGTWDKDLGRPNTVLLYPEKQQRRNIIRYSDKYVQDSKVNGLSNFQETNYELIPNDIGYVRKITPLESILLINGERETATAYIDQTIFKGSDGRDVAAVSSQVINNVRKLAGGFGCINPESIKNYLGYVYFYSSNKGAVCRYNNSNGLFPISEYKARTYFYQLHKFASLDSTFIGGYEPRFKNYLLTPKNVISYTPGSGFISAPLDYYVINTSTPDSLTPTQKTIAQVPNGNIYVGALGSNYVSVIDKDTNLLITSIDVSSATRDILYCPYNGKIYACGGGVVVCIDPDTNTISTSISVGSNNFYMAYCPTNNYIYISDPDDNTVHVISAVDNSFVTDVTLSVPADPIQIMYVGDVDKIYCLDNNASKIYCIDPATNIATFTSISFDSLRMVYATNNRRLYIVSRAFSSVTSYSVDTNSIVNVISGIGGNSFWPAYGNGYIYVPSRAAGKVYIIDTATDTVVSNITCGTTTSFCVFNSNDNIVYCSNSGTNTISLINTLDNTLVTNLTTGDGPQYALVGDNTKVYIPNTTSNSVSIIVVAYILNETIAFQEGSNRWISKYSFIPENYGYVSNEMFSFLDGELWKHNATEVYNKFHGTQYTSQVNPVFSNAPSNQKNFTYISLESDKVWAANPIRTAQGQETFILEGHFEKIQNGWYADIKQDINTPNLSDADYALFNGDFIQSNALNVLLETQSSDSVKLRFATVYSNVINR